MTPTQNATVSGWWCEVCRRFVPFTENHAAHSIPNDPYGGTTCEACDQAFGSLKQSDGRLRVKNAWDLRIPEQRLVETHHALHRALTEERDGLRAILESHAPEGHNVTNRQYVELLKERDGLRAERNEAISLLEARFVDDTSAQFKHHYTTQRFLERMSPKIHSRAALDGVPVETPTLNRTQPIG